MGAALFKWIVYISSWIPAFIMIFLNNLKSFGSEDLLSLWNANTIFLEIVLFSSVISLFVLIGWLLFMKSESKSDQAKYKIEDINSIDLRIVKSFVLYIIPILTLKLNSYPSIVMNLFLLVIMGVIIVNDNVLYLNFLILLFGYHVYTFGTNNIIITRFRKDKIEFKSLKATQIGTTNIFYI